MIYYVSTNTLGLIIPQARSHLLVEILQLHGRFDHNPIPRNLLIRRPGLSFLIGYLPHDLLQEIVHGNHPAYDPVLVDNHGKMLSFGLEFTEEVIDLLRLRDEIDGSQVIPQRLLLRLPEKVLYVQDSDNSILISLVYGDSGISFSL